MKVFIPRKKSCLLDCLDWYRTEARALMLALSGDVTLCFRLHAKKLFASHTVIFSLKTKYWKHAMLRSVA